ncbi:Sensory-regulatory protein RpfC [Marine Group I thaumarchaeote SCGC AAA799-P11]|uniref:histidine kinase n=1 Tax=Marine Group I thaumarchaeote SCGC AAA799-P11 TaxID=1502295 RepID=A0A087RZB3_9ARCH|nr:Sensory-regulatory protein RpfC [Marine Group I thaumarchaeote SCGC AAA799-P11]
MKLRLDFLLNKYGIQSLFLSFGLISAVFVGMFLYADSHVSQIEHHREKTVELTKLFVSDRQSSLQIIANSFEAFYFGSDFVSIDEFKIFSQRILQDNQGITSLFVVKNSIIEQSFPYDEYYDKPVSIFDSYPIKISDQKVLMMEFPLEDKLLLISVPAEYFVSHNLVFENSQIVLTNHNNDVLYSEENVSNSFLKNSDDFFSFTINTSLFGHAIGENYVLNYTIKDESFSYQFGYYDYAIIILGVSFAVFFSCILIKNSLLRNNINSKHKQLQKLVISLKNSEKARDEFSAMITHELKTPLVPINGYCRMLKKKQLGNLNEEQLDAVKEIEKNSNQLLNLIQNVLNTQKIEAGGMHYDIKDISVSEFMNSIKKTLLPYMEEKQIQFDTSFDENLVVKTDKSKLIELFTNLVQNSVDFVPANGMIEIGAKDDTDMIKFYVKDNGCGISEEQQKNMFKKFYQIDTSITRKHGGSGLGLAICKGYVKGMNGNIWLESKEGKGTTFYFTLPKSQEKYVQSEMKPSV